MATLKRSILYLGAGVLLGWYTSSWARWARQQLLHWLWPLGPLKLERPLVAFDIEATGLNVSKDRILEIAAVKVWPDGKVEVKGPQRLNPRVHISAEVTAIHHITQEDLVDCPSFADVAQEWRDFLEGCDLAGYNAKKFDVPMLRNEFRRAQHFNFPPLGVPVVDAFRIFCQQEPRTLSAAVQFYCGRSHSKADAHSALGDADATLRVLVEQVHRYGDLPRSVAELASMCAKASRAQDITPDGKFQWRGDQPIVAFGKHGGEPIAVLIAQHKDHLMWMAGQDWGDETLILVGQALKGMLPTKDGGWQPLFDSPPLGPSAAAAAAPNSSHSRGRQHKQQQEQQPQQQQVEEAVVSTEQQQQQPDAAAATTSSSTQEAATADDTPTASTSASAASAAAAAAAAASSLWQPAPHKGRGKPIYVPPPHEFTGWPDLGSASDSTLPTQSGDSWAVEPAPVAAAGAAAAGGAADTLPAQTADSWGAAPAPVADTLPLDPSEGWSMLDSVGYESNPGPQTPRAEPEVWDSGEEEESGDWQQQQEQQQQQQQLLEGEGEQLQQAYEEAGVEGGQGGWGEDGLEEAAQQQQEQLERQAASGSGGYWKALN